MDLDIRPFQRRFLTAALKPGIRTAALSMPRGNGKTTLAAWLCARLLTPGDVLHRPGTESYLCASSIGQCRRTTFKVLRMALEGDDYRIAESAGDCHVTHRESKTRISVLASSGKTAQGLVHAPWVVADEPGSWEVAGGLAMHEAIQFAQGKPASPLKALYIGTIAPSDGAGWWGRMLAAGSQGSTHVTLLQAAADDVEERWDRWSVIRRCNPLMVHFPESRATLKEDREMARNDTRLLAAFKSYRLNVPTADESVVLLTVDDWKRIAARPVPEASGRPLVGIDLGGGRAWSSAVACWPNGRVEALAVCPGVPDVRAQEKRDGVEPGTYQALVDQGTLHVAEGFRIPPVKMVLGLAAAWMPRAYFMDRYRIDELHDAKPKVPVIPRVPGWKHGGQDVRGLRRMAKDGTLAAAPESHGLLKASLAVAKVENDREGNTRPVKSGTNNRARDDVAIALMLSAAAVARMKPRSKQAAAVVCG